MSQDNTVRVGRFFIPSYMLTTEAGRAEVLVALAGLIPIRVEHSYYHQGFEYTALGECFDPVPQYAAPPEYRAVFEAVTKADGDFINKFKCWQRIP